MAVDKPVDACRYGITANRGSETVLSKIRDFETVVLKNRDSET